MQLLPQLLPSTSHVTALSIDGRSSDLVQRNLVPRVRDLLPRDVPCDLVPAAGRPTPRHVVLAAARICQVVGPFESESVLDSFLCSYLKRPQLLLQLCWLWQIASARGGPLWACNCSVVGCMHYEL